MKKIIIELSDEQYQEMEDHIRERSKIDFEEDTFSGYKS